MSSLFGIVSILLALVASGHALSCTNCHSTTSTSCTGPTTTCPKGFVCAAAFLQTSDGKISYVRSCTRIKNCNFNGSITTSEVSIKGAVSCCSTEDCTPTLPTLPKSNSTANGAECNSCFSNDGNSCTKSETVKCTGDEDHCLSQTFKGNVADDGSEDSQDVLLVLSVNLLSYYWPTVSPKQTRTLATALEGCASSSICGFNEKPFSVLKEKKASYHCNKKVSSSSENSHSESSNSHSSHSESSNSGNTHIESTSSESSSSISYVYHSSHNPKLPLPKQD
ncbi:vitellogenin-2-like [Hyperolius riggenbachi]|uniref:vitellogenin-2-like n=1 Tax=Hyperolius riggenbachi TaxID=752182 RepID=UPI0035A2C107